MYITKLYFQNIALDIRLKDIKMPKMLKFAGMVWTLNLGLFALKISIWLDFLVRKQNHKCIWDNIPTSFLTNSHDYADISYAICDFPCKNRTE